MSWMERARPRATKEMVLSLYNEGAGLSTVHVVFGGPVAVDAYIVFLGDDLNLSFSADAAG